MWRAPVIRCAGAVLIWLAVAGAGHASSFIDPRLSFARIETPHFIIYFNRGEGPQAARLAAIAEEVWQAVASRLGLRAPTRTHVILVDQTELANGWATPLPYNTLLVSAAAPAGSDQVGRTDDWLRLVFTHEFTHVVHLDRSVGWARVVRDVFGRTPIALPNLFLPTWQIEGLAAFEESAITGQGRLHAGDFRAIETEAARARRVPPLDRINGGVTDWPAGTTPYAYGLGFHQYLADRFGEARLGELARATAGRVPYTSAPAFKALYRESLGQLWREYTADLDARAHTQRTVRDLDAQGVERLTATRLTHHGYVVLGPRFGQGAEIVYSIRSPDGFPSLRSIDLDGGHSQQLATRYLGSTVGIAKSAVVFDQQEMRRNTGLYSDLFALDRDTGNVRPLTHEARLLDPDVSPDGTTIACVQEHGGRRDLVIIRLGDRSTGRGIRGLADRGINRSQIVTLVSAPETQFNAPRFSPDGRRIAAERRRLGSLSDIVIVDIASTSLRVAASDPAARVVTPTWTPDGRAIVAAADYGEHPFQLYEYVADNAAAAPRQLTNLPGGATWPDVSPDGRTIVFVGYTADGFDLFSTPYAPEPARLRVAPAPDTQAEAAGHESSVRALPARGYSPWPTILPTSLSPVLETIDDAWRAGATVAGADVLGRHEFAATATWLLNVPHADYGINRAAPGWEAVYVYTRWRPNLFLSASSDIRFAAGPPDDLGRPIEATLKEAQLEAGLVVPFAHVRSSHEAFVSLTRTRDEYTFVDHADRFNRSALRLAWASRTAQLYGRSISPERGVTIGGTAELVRPALGSDSDATTLTADARGYLPAFATHDVFAIRAAAGASSGDRGATRIFRMGGSPIDAGVIDFDENAIGLLRGFPSDAFAGTHAALINVEYRFPLGRPQRGRGTFPLLLHAFHAAVFSDAGQAWTSRFDLSDVKASVGAELSTDLIGGYVLPFTVAAGAAWAHDGAREVTDGIAFYVRVGRAF